MARPGSIDRLRSYLDRLSSSRRLDLLKQIAIASAREGSSSDLALILEALRPGLEHDLRAESGTKFGRLIFFRPCEPFLVDDRGSTKHRGFIHRHTLDGLWKWLHFRTEWTNWGERTEAAVAAYLSGNVAEADALVSGMRADAAGAIHEAMDMAGRSELFRQKLTLRVGGPQCFADLIDIAEVFEREQELGQLGRRVSDTLGLPGPPLEHSAIDELVAELADVDDPPLTLALVLVFRQLSEPTDILRLLTTFEGTDNGATLANSRLSACADVLLADLDFTAARIDQQIGDAHRYEEMREDLIRFHHVARTLNVAIDLDKAPAWRLTLGERRRWVAASLSSEISDAPDAIMRALRPPRGSGADELPPEVTDRAVYLARLLTDLRPLRSELAVNGAVMEALRKVETFLETLRTAMRGGRSGELSPAEAKRRETMHMVFEIFAGPAATDEADGEAGEDDEALAV